MKKNILLTTMAVLSVASVFGQTSKNRYQFKTYTNFFRGTYNYTYLQSGGQEELRNEVVSTRVGNITPALVLTKPSGNFLELEYMRFDIHRDKYILDRYDVPSSTTVEETNRLIHTTDIAFRFEYNWHVFSKESAKWSTFIGAGVVPAFSRMATEPGNSQSFDSKTAQFSAEAFLVPRIQYALNERWFIEANIPIHLAEISREKQVVDNPNFSARQQKTTTNDFVTFPNRYSARMGVGLRI